MPTNQFEVIKNKLESMIDPDGDGWFTEEGSRLFFDTFQTKYDYDAWKPWLDALPESPVKKAMLIETDITIV